MGLPISTDRLRGIITAQLLEFCPNVAYMRAKRSSGPRIVFLLDTIEADEVMRLIQMDVQEEYEQTHTRAEWLAIMGRNYL